MATASLLALLAAHPAGAGPKSGPECATRCAGPETCKNLKHCMARCNTATSEARRCLDNRRVDEATYTAAVGHPPDDFDAMVTAQDGAGKPAPEPVRSDKPEQLSLDVMKRALSSVDYRSCPPPAIDTTVMVKLTIGRNGRISQAATTTHNPTADCVITSIKTAKFPEFTGEPMHFTYPVIMKKEIAAAPAPAPVTKGAKRAPAKSK